MILNDRSFEGIGPSGVEFCGESIEQGFIDQIAFRAIRQEESATIDLVELVLDADRRGKAAEEETAGSEHTPCGAKQGGEVCVVAGKVEDGAADDHIGECIWKRHRFYRLAVEIAGGEIGSEDRGEATSAGDCFRVFIDREDFKALSQEINEIAPTTAADVEDAHAGRDPATMYLVKEIDVDLTKLLHKAKRVHLSMLFLWLPEVRVRPRKLVGNGADSRIDAEDEILVADFKLKRGIVRSPCGR